MKVLGYDAYPSAEYEAATPGFSFVSMDELLRESDVVSIHAPLMPETYHMIDEAALAKMKPGAMLLNMGRGGLVDTKALIAALKTGHIGSAGLDVYEEESAYFFEDRSSEVIADDVLARLMSFNNVLVTSHQAFLTTDALANIAETTRDNIREWIDGKRGDQLTNHVPAPKRQPLTNRTLRVLSAPMSFSQLPQ